MNIRSPLIRNLLWGLATVALVWGVWSWRTGVDVRPPERSPQAEGLAMVGPDGSPVRLEASAGAVVVVNLWASWCGYCRMEIPDLNELHDRYRDEGLVVLGLNLEDGGPQDLVRRAGELGIRYPVARPSARLEGPFGSADVLPHTWIVDRQGRVRVSHSGYVSGRSLDRAVRRLLGEG